MLLQLQHDICIHAARYFCYFALAVLFKLTVTLTEKNYKLTETEK